MTRAVLLATVLLAAGSPANADHVLWQSGDGPALRASALALGRLEYWEWYGAGPGYRNRYFTTFETLRPALALRWGPFGAVVEGQATGIQGLPLTGVAPAPKGALGGGAIYYQHVLARDGGAVFLKHAYLEHGNMLRPFVPGVRLRAGRFPYSDGVEVMTGEAKLDWLKKIRVSERLIGPFGWSAFQRSYDGVDAGLTGAWGGLTGLAAQPTQGGFEEVGGTRLDRVTLTAAALSLNPGIGVPHTAARAFFIGYEDERKVTQRVDNVKGAAAAADVEVLTVGGEVLGAYPAGNGEADALLWGAMQRGDWYELEHGAYAAVAEAGYQFKQVRGAPHLRLGGALGSGDGDPADTTHGTFFQILPTARKYALAPFHNMMNLRDLYAQVFAKPLSRLTLRAEFHRLDLADAKDRWYAGAGATQAQGASFGYAGRPSLGETALGNLADLSLGWAATPSCTINFYAGRLFGGALPDALYGDSSGTYGFVETELKW